MTPDMLYDGVAYAILGFSLLLMITVCVLYLRDGVQQVPRFGVALKWLGISFLFGLLMWGIYALSHWVWFLILAGTFAGMPAIIILFVCFSMLKEATKFQNAIALVVLGGGGGILLGIFLLLIRRALQGGLL